MSSGNRATTNQTYSLYCKMSSSEDNRIIADKCIDVAEDAAARCEFAKAERLLMKAERLCPLVDVKQLLREVRAKMKGASSSNGRRASVYVQSSHDDDSVDEASEQCLQKAQAALDRGELEAAERWAARAQRMRKSIRGERLLQRVDEAKKTRPRPQTAEQEEALRRATDATSDHDRLGVEQQASAATIKRAYRRLTLLLHPDKNHAPEAVNAFMGVTDAYTRLLKKSVQAD